jgi:hypothetical protein
MPVSPIHEYVSARCPFDRVPAYLATHLARSGGSVESAVLPMRLQLGDIVIEHAISISLRRREGYPGYSFASIAWEAEGGGPFPSFSGSLSAADEGAGFCRLDIDGTYAPPLGPAGALFDAVLGKRIAQASVGDLLLRFKQICEAAYAAEHGAEVTQPL